MDFNNLFFPAPKPTYNYSTFLPYFSQNDEGLLSVPKVNSSSHIPCLLIRYRDKIAIKQHKILLFFHGNAEDLGHCEAMLRKITKLFHVSVDTPIT